MEIHLSSAEIRDTKH